LPKPTGTQRRSAFSGAGGGFTYLAGWQSTLKAELARYLRLNLIFVDLTVRWADRQQHRHIYLIFFVFLAV
jgi:hypothetical protein